ncbi:MAG: PASTA domain-containing protein [Eubacterium sp.]|nr:PASTA domain-containing protein [Eubacterium sp.]
MSNRIVILFFGILIAAVCIALKLFDVSVVNNEMFSAAASKQQQDSFTITASRGTIYDRNNKVLVQSNTVWDVIISPGDINEYEPQNRDFICRGLSEILDVKYETLVDACSDTDLRYYVAKRKVDRTVVEKINNFISKNRLQSVSIYTVENSVRSYPNDDLAASVLGFVNDNEEGYGIEAYYNDYLKGVDGRIVSVKDANGDAMPYEYETRYPAQDGNSLILTLDETLQYYLEKNLETTVSQHGVENRSTGIIMNAKTGAIVAMATYPGYDPNDPSYIFFEKDRKLLAQMSADGVLQAEIDKEEAELRGRQWLNKAVSEIYIPGSVFKMITCSAALEEEAVSLGDTFYCSGVADVEGTKIRCWSAAGHGTSTLTEAVIRSCNPAFIAIGQRLGVENFTKYFQAYGFTELTGIDLPGEAHSLYVSKENMHIVELSSSAFGQTNKVTAIQMITAAAAVVNGGKLMTPYIVDKIIDSDGNVIKSTEPTVRRQVISEETSATMRQILETVVSTNGGTNAYMEGYRIGGKSGTAEKLDEYSYDNMRYVSIFCAFVPADDPEYIMLVIVDEPTSGFIYGSAVAAPVVSAVFKEGLEYLNIYPQYTAEELREQDVTVPWIYGDNSLMAEAKLTGAGLNAKIIGSTEGTTVTGVIPGAGTLMPYGGTVLLYMGDGVTTPDYQFTTVPDFTGMTVEQANIAAGEAGLNLAISGAGGNSAAVAISQSLTKGTSVYSGSVVEVTFVLNSETG